MKRKGKKLILLEVFLAILCMIACAGYYFNKNYIIFNKRISGLCKDNSDCPSDMFCNVVYDDEHYSGEGYGAPSYALCEYVGDINHINYDNKDFTYSPMSMSQESAWNWCKATNRRIVKTADIVQTDKDYGETIYFYYDMLDKYKGKFSSVSHTTLENIENQIKKCEEIKEKVLSKEDKQNIGLRAKVSIPFCEFIAAIDYYDNPEKHSPSTYWKGAKTINFDFWTDVQDSAIGLGWELYRFNHANWGIAAYYLMERPLCVEDK